MGFGRDGKRSAAEVTEFLNAAAERCSDMVALARGVCKRRGGLAAGCKDCVVVVVVVVMVVVVVVVVVVVGRCCWTGLDAKTFTWRVTACTWFQSI